MSLYLCIYEFDTEVHGIDMGSYSDFNTIRYKLFNIYKSINTINPLPTLMNHSDCEGEWSPLECKILINELNSIKEIIDKYHQDDLTDIYNFIDAILYLSHLSIRYNSPIIFQ
jgi:hypothetical protein